LSIDSPKARADGFNSCAILAGNFMPCLFNRLNGILHTSELLLDCDLVVGAITEASRVEDGVGEILRLLNGA